MKRNRHIRTRLSVTMIALTCGILIAVMLAFNITVRSYIRSRVSTRLGEVMQSVSDDRRSGDHAQKDKKHFDGKPDRETGAEYCAAVLREDGSVETVLSGSETAARELDYRDQELRQLAESMNQMVRELDQAKTKQESFFRRSLRCRRVYTQRRRQMIPII